MNIASGNSSKKEHLSIGSRTACNRKMSTGKSEKSEFKYMLLKNPDMCCSKCASKLILTKRESNRSR